MKRKVLFAVTSHGELGNTGKPTGYYLSEVTHPWDELVADYDIDVVSPKGGKPPVDGFDLKDPVNKKYWDDPAWQDKMSHTLKPEDVNPNDYIGIFYAGGHGVMWDFPNNKRLAEICAQIYENGGVVAAVCHGPAGLLNVVLSDGDRLIKNKKVNSFTNAEEKANGTDKDVPFLLQTALEEKGANYDCAPPWSDFAITDGRLVTGQNPMSAKKVGKLMNNMLGNVGK